MNYLCLECTKDFIAECVAVGLGLKGVSYSEPGQGHYSCARCGRELPESDENEQEAKSLLTRTLVVLADRQDRAFKALKGAS
jgi:DNA-directed RNA polymerase subunit RPC12/RpoP